MFCGKCGCKLVENAKFCEKCGAPVNASGNQYIMRMQNPGKPVKPVKVESPAAPVGKTKEERKRKKGKIPILIGVSVAAVALLSVGLFYLFHKEPEEAPVLETRSSETVSEATSVPQEQEKGVLNDPIGEKEPEEYQDETLDDFEDYETDDYDGANYDGEEDDDTEDDDTEDYDDDDYEQEEEDDEEDYDDEEDIYAYTPEDALRKYARFYVDAVNSGDFTGAEYCMKPGSKIYKTQKKLVKNLFNRNIREQLSYCGVSDVTYLNDYKAEVVSDEGIFVYKDGEEKLVEQSYIYTCVKEGDIWLLTNMR